MVHAADPGFTVADAGRYTGSQYRDYHFPVASHVILAWQYLRGKTGLARIPETPDMPESWQTGWLICLVGICHGRCFHVLVSLAINCLADNFKTGGNLEKRLRMPDKKIGMISHAFSELMKNSSL